MSSVFRMRPKDTKENDLKLEMLLKDWRELEQKTKDSLPKFDLYSKKNPNRQD